MSAVYSMRSVSMYVCHTTCMYAGEHTGACMEARGGHQMCFTITFCLIAETQILLSLPFSLLALQVTCTDITF